MAEQRGVRGYIASRPIRGTTYPQRVQNVIVREYAVRRGLTYLLSSVEYAMPGSYMILADVLGELDRLDGVVFFSLFMLPEKREERFAVYGRFLATRTTLHAALENRALASLADVAGFEETLLVARALERTPFAGRYEKTGTPLEPGTVVSFIKRTLK
jgi:sporadic carbohydrate cluster protein (TIGR04323 family)